MFVVKAFAFILPHLMIISALNRTKFKLYTTIPTSSSSANFLRLYQQNHYLLLLHVTNQTKYLANDFLAAFPTMTVIFNHDTIPRDYLKRPHGLHLLNLVIFENPLIFSEYSNQLSNIKCEDVIVFLMRPRNFDILTKKHAAVLPNLQKSGRVIVVVAGDILTNIYMMCFFCGKTSGTFVTLETLKSGSFATNSSLIFASDYRNFNGHVLKVGYIDYFPYVFCEKKIENICEEAIGIEIDILKATSKALNFKFQLIESTNQSYRNLIFDLIYDKFDFAIGGLSMTIKRRQYLQFTDVYKFEEVALIFYFKESFLSSVKEIFYLTFLGRQLFFVVLITITVLIFLINRYLAKRKTSAMVIAEIIFQIGNDRPSNLKPILPETVKSGVAIFLAIWLFYAMLCNIFYKSKLLSILIAHPVEEIKVSDLLKENYIFMADDLASTFYASMLQPELSLDKIKIENYDLCEAFDQISHNRTVILGELSRHLFHLLVHCKDYVSGNFPKELIVQKFGVTPFAWPFRKGSPFVKSFNNYHKYIFQSGLRTMWWHRILLKRGFYRYFNSLLQKSDKIVSLNGFVIQFIIYFFMILFTVVVLLLEIVIFRVKQNRKCVK